MRTRMLDLRMTRPSLGAVPGSGLSPSLGAVPGSGLSPSLGTVPGSGASIWSMLTVIRWLGAMLGLALMGLAQPLWSAAPQTPAGSGPAAPPSPSAGEYRLEALPPGQPRQLPPPGDEGRNGCEAGEPVGIRWSPDGRQLAVEVDTGSRLALCLYDLAAFSLSGNAATVIMRGVSTTGLLQQPVPARPDRGTATGGGSPSVSGSRSDGTGSSPSIYQRLSRGQLRRYASSDYELRWSPTAGRGPQLAFTRKSGDTPSSVMGISERFLTAASRLSRLDRPASPRTYFSQPAWGPASSSPTLDGSGDPRLTLVSNLDLDRCGRERLVVVRGSGTVTAALEALTHPCEPRNLRAEGNEGADRSPAWDPVLEHDRLAFLRTAPGFPTRVCLLEGYHTRKKARLSCEELPRDTRGAMPTHLSWTRDGRYLLYYLTTGSTGRPPDVLPETGRPPDGSSQPPGETRPAGANRDLGAEAGADRTDSRGASTTEDRAGEQQSVMLGVMDFTQAVPSHRVVARDILPNDWQEVSLLEDAQGGHWALVLPRDKSGERSRLELVWVGGGARPDARAHPLESGLQNIRATELVQEGQSGIWRLAVVAQGRRGVREADQSGYKVFVLPVRAPAR